MGKKIFTFLGIALLGTLVWYLFIKPHDYQVTFEAKTFPGAIHQIVKTWGTTLEGSKILNQDGINELTQELQFGDSTHSYTWEITKLHDSLSQIRVYAKDKDHSFQNKISIPFSDTDFEKRTRKTLLDFSDKLKEHSASFKVEVIGEDTTRTTFCACTSLKSTQFRKANGMMRDYPLLSEFLGNNNIQLNGPPFLEVTEWNKEEDGLQFKFCFPIIQSDILPEHPELTYRKFYGTPALKAIYNGNYITSDRAWYALLDYAKENNYEVTQLPVEVFYNNPNMGGDALNWKAEIFMPLKTPADD